MAKYCSCLAPEFTCPTQPNRCMKCGRFKRLSIAQQMEQDSHASLRKKAREKTSVFERNYNW